MSGEPLHFEDFALDRSAYELRRGGAVVRLQRIPLELLFLLVERRGQLVTREEILERVWGKGVFVDVDNAINTAVRKIRRALDDDPEAPRFLVTVPAKGYRFVAPVRAAPVAPAPVRPPPSPVFVSSEATPFVGREREMGELRRGLEEAIAGRGRLFLISGAPGVGKTRLAAELATLADAKGVAVAIGRCSEQDEAVSYLPFVEILESCVARASSADPLAAVVGEQGPELALLLPKLRRILPDLPAPLELPPEQARRHLFNCFYDFIARRARMHPTLLILDDLHWADDSTLAMLGHLAQRVSDMPVLILGTYRDVEVDLTRALAKTLDDLLRGRLTVGIKLKGLPLQAVAKMLTGLSSQSPPAAVVSEIYAETRGNPFFVEEVFRYLEEENQLYDSTGEFRPELNIDEQAVPQSVRLVVGRRLARLSDRAQKMLATAATIGRSFAFEVLQWSAGPDSDALLDCLEEAEKAGLVLSSTENSETRLEFSHELIRQTVLSGLSAPRRQRLHLEVAGAMERVYPDTLDDHCSQLASHYRLGGKFSEAIKYLWRTVVRDYRRSAFPEAIASLVRSIELLQKLPDNEQRARDELELQTALVNLWWHLRGPGAPETRAAIERRLQLGEQVGDNNERFWALNFMISSYTTSLEISKACEFAERQLALAKGAGDPTMLAVQSVGMGDLLLHQGKFVEARERIEKGLAMLPDPPPPNSIGAEAPWTRGGALSLGACDLWLLGYPGQALDWIGQALAAANESIPFFKAGGLLSVARVYMLLRDRRTLEIASSLTSLAKENGLSLMAGVGPLFVGWALLEQGQATEGVAELQRARTEAPSSQRNPTWLSAMLADARGKLGRTAGGLRLVADALRLSEESGERISLAELHRLHGELLLMQDAANVAEAERCFQTAIEVACGQSARSWELRASMSFARLLAKQGRREEARSTLADVYGWFTEGFDTADLIDAKALLDRLSA